MLPYCRDCGFIMLTYLVETKSSINLRLFDQLRRDRRYGGSHQIESFHCRIFLRVNFSAPPAFSVCASSASLLSSAHTTSNGHGIVSPASDCALNQFIHDIGATSPSESFRISKLYRSIKGDALMRTR